VDNLFRFVNVLIERIDNLPVDKQDKKLKDGTEDSEDRSNEVSYCKFLGIAPEVGPIGKLVRLHKKIGLK
jgi:hypothetical protein